MKTAIIDILGIGANSEKILLENGFKTLKEIASSTVEKLARVPGFGVVRAGSVIKAANELLSASLSDADKAASSQTSRVKPIPVKGTRDRSSNKNKQQKDTLRKVKLRKEKLRKEKAKKDKLKKEKLRKEKLRKEKLKKEKPRKKKQKAKK
jgi:NAD-dependent DNA ligase